MISALTDSDIAPVTDDAVIKQSANRDAVRKGAIVERMFEIAALERGYEVSVNIGGGKDFDHIVRRPGSRPVVVQIKTARLNAEKKHYVIDNCGRAGVYSAQAYDVLAAFCPDRNQWLFYSRSELGNRQSTSYTPLELRRYARRSFIIGRGECPADRNPNNWELLDDVAQSLTNSGPRTANVPDPQ